MTYRTRRKAWLPMAGAECFGDRFPWVTRTVAALQEAGMNSGLRVGDTGGGYRVS